MKAGWYRFRFWDAPTWIIVFVTDRQDVLFAGTDVDEPLLYMRDKGEFGPEIPRYEGT